MTERSEQREPGYREAALDPLDVLICNRCGCLVKQDETDRHDRWHVDVEHPATMPATMTRGPG